MRVNIQNMLRQAGNAIPSHRDTCAYSYMLQVLAGHLLQLRDRTQADDLTALDEFFQLYVFDDGKDYARPAQETSVGPDTDVATKAACSCKHSDSWRCAVARGLTSVSCGCLCHRATANR